MSGSWKGTPLFHQPVLGELGISHNKFVLVGIDVWFYDGVH